MGLSSPSMAPGTGPPSRSGLFCRVCTIQQWQAQRRLGVFADNFSGGPDKTASGRATYRPCGLAQGPDGSIYVTDDTKGNVWKITYKK